VGELEEDDGGDLDFLLPPRVVVGPDENGLKKVIEYRFDDDGNKVKVTTTTRVPSPQRAMPRSLVRFPRRAMPRSLIRFPRRPSGPSRDLAPIALHHAHAATSSPTL